MTLNDKAVLVAAVGHIYVADVGAVAPTPAELKTVALEKTSGWSAKGWMSVGHTSREDLPEFGKDGGDTETIGTWQNQKIREIAKEAATDSVTFKLQQFDDAAMGLFYGPNASTTAGVFSVKDSTAKVEKALLIIVVDGDLRVGFHAARASLRREEAIELATDKFASLPVKATFLSHPGAPMYSWINADLFGTKTKPTP